MGNMRNKARSILVSAILALMLCNVSGITVYLHLCSAAAHHNHDCDDKDDKSCPVCEQAVFSGKYYNAVEVVCLSISETAAAVLLIPAFYVFANHWTVSFKIRPPPMPSFC